MTASAGLTPEEESKPYAKYYSMRLSEPDAGLLAQLRPENPIDPEAALAIEDLDRLLEPGYLPVETGWCVLPNGAGYVAVHTIMPGVTVEMVNWWFAWHGLEALRYKIWWPKGHLSVSVGDDDRAKILDPNLPLTDKFQGRVHTVVEDVGVGIQTIDIHFLRPEDMGFDMERFVAPNVGTVVGGFGWASTAGAPPDAPREPAAMCHFIREVPGGIEFRTRFWLGYTIRERVPVLLVPPGVSVPLEATCGLARHNVEEYSNLRVLLPLISCGPVPPSPCSLTARL